MSLIPGTSNFRDTGGIPVRGGGQIASGVLYRSDALAHIPDEAQAAFAATGITVIVDLRAAHERETAPNNVDQQTFRTVELPLLEGMLTPPKGADLAEALARVPSLAELYIQMLEHGAATFAQVARTVARADGAALVHCTAGKDRTGVSVALLLIAVGAERAAVVANYTESERNLAGPWAERMLAGMARYGLPQTPQIVELVTATPAAAIEGALDWVEARGGAAAYLREAGLSDDDLAALRSRLVDA